MGETRILSVGLVEKEEENTRRLGREPGEGQGRRPGEGVNPEAKSSAKEAKVSTGP